MLDRLAKRNLGILVFSQAMTMSFLTLTISVAALVGDELSPRAGLATLPIAFQFIGTMAVTIPASLLMGRYGRRLGFSLGALCGIVSCVLAAVAIITQSFYLFCLSAFIAGAAAAFSVFYRFAAVEAVSETYKAKAISWVMLGGVVAAFLGPALAALSKDLIGDAPFAGCYLLAIALHVCVLIATQMGRLPKLHETTEPTGGRPWPIILRQRTLVIAILAGMVGYGAMNLVMVPTPLAMTAYAHSFETAAFVIQWHVVGMYAPSFVTGHLIERFGVFKIISAGCALILCAAIANLLGQTAINFWSGLTLLGVGWNFMYIGASTLLTDCYRPDERAKVQAANDFLIFGMTVLTSLSAGVIFDVAGWSALNLTVVLPVIATLLLILWAERLAASAKPPLASGD